MLPKVNNKYFTNTPKMDDFYSPEHAKGEYLVDYALGGINLRDTSKGLSHRVWKGTYNPTTGEFNITSDDVTNLIFTKPDVTEISFTFDVNMSPIVLYKQNNRYYYYWFDTVTRTYTEQSLPEGIHAARITIDERRKEFTATVSDVIILYQIGKRLLYRLQKDRFTIEYPLIRIDHNLWHVSMMRNNRVGVVTRSNTHYQMVTLFKHYLPNGSYESTTVINLQS